MKLINKEGKLSPVLKILTDYPRDDLAHDEVHQALVTACVESNVDFRDIDVGAIPSLDTVSAGFKTAQLSLNSTLGFGHVFHANCAPRKNLVSVKSQGEKVVLGITPSGVTMLIVNSGYALAPFYELAEEGGIHFYQTSVRDSGSQFRSRDFFPEALAELASHLSQKLDSLGADQIGELLVEKKFDAILEGLSYLGEPLSLTGITKLSKGSVTYVDNFGNIKLNIKHKDLLALYPAGSTLLVRLGDSLSEAVVGDVGFSQGEGVLALTSGSSGWNNIDGEKEFFTEIFFRGSRAASLFKNFSIGDQVMALGKEEMVEVVEILNGADSKLSEKLNLENTSEAKILKFLTKAKLITDGFDASWLKEVIKQGTLLDSLEL